jgi:hypothetical protein
MRPRWQVAVILFAIPAFLLVLWAVSGREFHTKTHKAVAVAVRDEVFGDTTIEEKFIRGPLLGYYIGIDAVIVFAFLALAATGVYWWWSLRRERRTPRLIEGRSP